MKAASYGSIAALLTAILLALVTGGVQGDVTTVSATGLTLPISAQGLESNNMAVLWQTRALMMPQTRLTNLWLAGDFLVCRGSDNTIYVINATTGVRMFSVPLGNPDERTWKPTALKDNLWIATTSSIWGFQAEDGREIGHTKIDFSPGAGIATNGAYVYIPDANGWLQAVSIGADTRDVRYSRAETDSAKNGRVDANEKERAEPELLGPDRVAFNRWPAGVWTCEPVLGSGVTRVAGDDNEIIGIGTRDVQIFGPGAKGWRGYSWGRWTGDTLTSTPVLDSSMIFFGSQDGTVYAMAQNTKKISWQYKTEGPIVGDLKISKNGLLLVPSLDYTVYAFQGSSGRLVWRYNAGEPVSRAPYTFPGQAFVFTQDQGLVALDLANGKAQWNMEDAAEVITADDSAVYAVTKGGKLVSINRPDGATRFTLPMTGGALTAVNETDSGVIYVATPDGQVMATGRKLTPEEIAAHEAMVKEASKPKSTNTKSEVSFTPPATVPSTPTAGTPAAPRPVTPRPVKPRPTPTVAPPPVTPPPTKPGKGKGGGGRGGKGGGAAGGGVTPTPL